MTHPLVQVTRAVEGLARNEEWLAVPTGATGEIGVLARAFTQMRTEVQETTSALQREVEERQRIFDTSFGSHPS